MSDYRNTNVPKQSVPPAAHEGSEDRSQRSRLRSVLWGIALVAIGLIFFVDKLDIFETIDLLHDWWPLILIAFGIYSGGHVLTGIGVWLLIGELRLFGLTYSASWPVILIVIGGSIVLRALFGDDRHHRNGCGLVEERR